MTSHYSAKKPEKSLAQKAVERAKWLARKEQGFAGLAGHGAGKHHTREWDVAKGRGKSKHKQDWSAERYAEGPTLTQPLMTRRDYGTGETKMATDLRSKLIRLAHANPSLRADILPLLKESKEKYPWDECISDQMKQYGDKEIAEKVCGKIKAQSQGLGSFKKADPAIHLAGIQVKLAHRPQMEREGLNTRAVAEGMGAMLYFIDSAKNHSKFYEMLIKPEGEGFVLKKRWGALTDTGKTGRTDEKVEMFMNLRGAQAALAKTYREKTGKGYKDAYNRKMHVSPASGEVLPLGQYPVGLTRMVGFGWGTQSATLCIPSLRDLQEKIEGALETLSEDSDLTDILADLQAADRIIGGLMRNREAIDPDTNRSMGDILAKALATPMGRIQALQGMARSSPGRAPMLDRNKLRKELVAIKNYIRKQLSHCA
jgi:predicted DNA-binding WGR domain protein